MGPDGSGSRVYGLHFERDWDGGGGEVFGGGSYYIVLFRGDMCCVVVCLRSVGPFLMGLMG